MLQEMEQPGARTMTICGPALKVPEAPLRISGPAPMLGQHPRKVLATWLGYGEERLDRLEEKGIVCGE